MKFALFLLLLATSQSAHAADFQSMAPSAVGDLLAKHALKTRAYRLQDGDVHYRASTPYKEIGAAFPLPNNLAYYISGEAKKVTQLKLVLNLNAPAESIEAVSELASVAESLMRAALEDPPIKEVVTAIRGSSSGAWTAKGRRIQLRRIDWPTGKGYELQVIIE
jgi:hypothetical protein